MRHTNEKKTTSERLSSPEDLNDYLRVTSPATWALLAALVLLLGGMVISSDAIIQKIGKARFNGFL